jgi:SAM-dependent methyltransferase
MHDEVFRRFQRICSRRKAGGAVLEIGAVPADDTLLCLPALSDATEKIGLNIVPPARFRDFSIVQGNANAMSCFPDQRFDTVLCNATLEHDKFFWKTLAEIRRVAKPGALIVLGAPGYRDSRRERWTKRLVRNVPLLGRELERSLPFVFASTLTLHVHDYPGDYYRFSTQTFEEVFFEGMHQVEITSVLTPPRIIGAGIKPR